MEELLKRHTPYQNKVIADFLLKLASMTNKTGKILDSKKLKILKSWEAYPTQTVIEGLEVYLKMEIPQSQYGKGKGSLSVQPNERQRQNEACRQYRKRSYVAKKCKCKIYYYP